MYEQSSISLLCLEYEWKDSLEELNTHRGAQKALRYWEVGSTYLKTPLEEMRQAWLAADIPAERVDTISEVLSERSRYAESRVSLDTHKAFGVHPTTFAEFARRNAAVFRGETMPL